MTAPISGRTEDASRITRAYSMSLDESEPVFDSSELNEFSIFGGAGVAGDSSIARSSFHFGADIRIVRPYYNRLFGMLYEAGYAGPMQNFSDGSALFSGNYLASTVVGSARRAILFGTVGYTVVFGDDDAVNFGIGLDIAIAREKALRIEIRDYLTYENPDKHNAALRLAFVFFAPPKSKIF